jgi:hypothetical protein
MKSEVFFDFSVREVTAIIRILLMPEMKHDLTGYSKIILLLFGLQGHRRGKQIPYILV